MPPSAIDENGRFPDIFARFRAARLEANIGYAYCWVGMPFVVNTNVCDFVVQTYTPSDETLDWIRENKPDLMTFIVSPPDGAGHNFGRDSPEYAEAV